MTPRSCPDPALDHRAFTLVELLVAVTVSIILLTLLIGVVSQTMRVMRHSNDSQISLNAVNTALGLLTTDLESLVASPRLPAYLQATGSSTDTVIQLVATAPHDSQTTADGQPRGVLYQLYKQNPVNPGSAQNKIWGLYRAVSDPGNTFSNLLSTNSSTAANAWVALQTAGTSQTNFIAGNIVGLEVALKVATNSYGTPFSVSGTGVMASNSAVASTNAAPLVAEISLTVLEEAGAKLFGANAIDLATAKQKYGKTLTSRVTLRSPY